MPWPVCTCWSWRITPQRSVRRRLLTFLDIETGMLCSARLALAALRPARNALENRSGGAPPTLNMPEMDGLNPGRVNSEETPKLRGHPGSVLSSAGLREMLSDAPGSGRYLLVKTHKQVELITKYYRSAGPEGSAVKKPAQLLTRPSFERDSLPGCAF